MIFPCNRIPWRILLRSDHDPGDPARYVDWCWIRNFITTIGHFISNITIVKVHKLRGSKYGMSKPCCIVSKHCVHALNWPWCSRIGTYKWRRHTSYCDVMNRYHFSFNHDHVISILNFPVNDLCHDSIGNKLFGFIFSRSDEPIVIGGLGSQDCIWADREQIVSGIGPRSSPGITRHDIRNSNLACYSFP